MGGFGHGCDCNDVDCYDSDDYDSVAEWGKIFRTVMLVMMIVKGTVQRDFRPPVFSSFEPVWAINQWVKIFSILVQISLSYPMFRFEKTDCQGYDTPGSKTDCPGYDSDTPGSKTKFPPRTMVQKQTM